jgi:hypothetical protein
MRPVASTLALFAVAFLPTAGLVGCASTASTPAGVQGSVTLPLQTAWFEGRKVRYITTDVSDADVARAKGANFVPRLRDLVVAVPGNPPRVVPVERVYSIEGFTQPTVFPSVPSPVGAGSTSRAYSPLWRMVKVVWQPGRTPRELRSEESVLDAEQRGDVKLVLTEVILNCPVVALDGELSLSGARVEPTPTWR